MKVSSSKVKNYTKLEKINSKYACNQIFDFIEDKNFKYKLFIHSKLYQKKLDIVLTDYEKISSCLDLNISDYLYNENPLEIQKKLDEDIKKYKLDKDIIQNYINLYFKILKLYPEGEKNIYLDSPFFDFVLKQNFFILPFTIFISADSIEQNNLLNIFKLKFEKINKINNLSLHFIFNNKDNIQYFTEFNIDTYKIKKLSLNNNFSLQNLFLFDFSNLTYLYISRITIKSDFFENINMLKSLEELNLHKIRFSDNCQMKLNNIKTLIIYIINDTLYFDEKEINKLKILKIDNNQMYTKSKIQFPELEELEMLSYMHDGIDFKSMKKLKKLTSMYYLSHYFQEDSLIEEMYFPLDQGKLYIKLFQNLCSFKFLKIISLNLSDFDMNEVNFTINSVERLHIIWNDKNKPCIINDLQSIFPSLIDIEINTNTNLDKSYFSISEAKIEIIQKPNCKINKFKISAENKLIQFYCLPFEKLIDININSNSQILNLNECFPIFNSKCNIVFKSLINLSVCLSSYYGNIYNCKELLKNLFNNFEKMPSLKKMNLIFEMDFIVDKKLYRAFIKKILYKLDEAKIKMSRTNAFYSKHDLKRINPNLNISKLMKFIISKS